MQKRLNHRGGFALPTVLIASVVMLTILAVSVSSVTAVRTTLKTQYYEQLAKAAGEAGVAYAKACLAQNGNVPLWTDNKPLTPSTDCAGNNSLGDSPFRALVVAGGGSGGGSTGGGGGGGGVITQDDFSLSTGSYSVVVGAGGAAPGNQAIGRNGANSSFNGWVAIGGGGGGYSAGGNSGAAGLSGGSGGGGQNYYGTYGPGSPTLGQGYAGGSLSGAVAQTATGGGGAGGPGMNTNTTGSPTGGDGGPGLLSTITGAAVYYGGGGGGGTSVGSCGATFTKGGLGGGGRGSDVGLAGLANSGGGGGGGWCYASGNGGAGGSGVVIIAYPYNGSVTATGGSQVYNSNGYRVHVFNSGGTFNVLSVTNSSCPTDPRCSVTVDDNLRSSFRVTKPSVDSNGRAMTIPNSGYVELLRSSTGEVWRTYRQPAVQSAVVPDLCSGAAASTLGWQNAIVSSTQQTLANASSAQTITMLDTNLAAGKMYFRKDFTVQESGSYNFSAITDSPSTVVAMYIDGALITTAKGPSATNAVNLTAGCHTATVQMTNLTLQPRAARFTAALQRSGAAPILATDSSWRVSSGSSVHFSQPDFDADPAFWVPVTDYQNPTAQQASSAWQTTQGDLFTRMISPTVSGCATACPAPASFYMRDSKDFYVSTPTEVQISTLCDDDCSVFMDGEMVIQNSPWSAINQQTMTITPGAHHIAVRTFNAAATPNPSGAAVSVVVKETGQVLTRTDRSWVGTTISTYGTNATTEDIRAYEASFRPSPDEIPRPTTLDLLVVGAGGGGGSNAAGGGGGGGVRYIPELQLGTGTYTVTIGAGGVIGTNSGTTTAARGQNGGNSSFGSYSATGGGGGASRDNGPVASSGGSGGGGAGPTSASREPGGAGVSGQGYSGGTGTAADQGAAAKGGGGGGAGGSGVNANTTVAGNGGAGFITYVTGSRLSFAGGGGGSNTAGNGYLGAATDGGVSGGVSNTNAGANTGGGGGGNSGAGGSGVVIVRVRTGSMTITTTGSPTITNVTVDSTAYTIYQFNASGSFTISAIN